MTQRCLHSCVLLTILLSLAACGGGGGGGNGGGGQNPRGTNRARLLYEVDLQGVLGQLEMEVEVISSTGIVWGPGSSPDIRGVIGTGGYTIYTAGELRSPSAYYSFLGENAFADFTEPATSQRFRVQWIETPNGLDMIVNPFGPGPVRYSCRLVASQAL